MRDEPVVVALLRVLAELHALERALPVALVEVGGLPAGGRYGLGRLRGFGVPLAGAVGGVGGRRDAGAAGVCVGLVDGGDGVLHLAAQGLLRPVAPHAEGVVEDLAGGVVDRHRPRPAGAPPRRLDGRAQLVAVGVVAHDAGFLEQAGDGLVVLVADAHGLLVAVVVGLGLVGRALLAVLAAVPVAGAPRLPFALSLQRRRFVDARHGDGLAAQGGLGLAHGLLDDVGVRGVVDAVQDFEGRHHARAVRLRRDVRHGGVPPRAPAVDELPVVLVVVMDVRDLPVAYLFDRGRAGVGGHLLHRVVERPARVPAHLADFIVCHYFLPSNLSDMLSWMVSAPWLLP